MISRYILHTAMALIIDTETSGLPDTSALRWGEYHHYTNIEKYDNARIVQFTMMLCNDRFEEINLADFIIKRDNFSIDNYEFHNITNEVSDTSGVPFSTVAQCFAEYLKQVSHIIAHNIAFDINVIKSELYRYGMTEIIQEIEKKELLCTMKHTRMIVRAPNKFGGIKQPSLAELYKFNFKKDIENAHNSKYDVINLHAILKHMYDNDMLNLSQDIIYTHHKQIQLQEILVE